MLSVVHVSFSQSGGAGKVARMLTEARTAGGAPTSHLFTIDKNLWTEPWSAPRHAIAAALDNFVVRSSDFGAPISLFRDSLESSTLVALEEADVIHLHSINGQLSLSRLAERWPDKKIVWTLHDMNPMTGTCHYSLECKGYITGCDKCPAVRGPFRQRVSVSLDTKRSALLQLKKLELVAPSRWLANVARESMALSEFPVHVIPNPVDPLFFAPTATSPPGSDYTFAIIAQNLSDPVKNVATAVETFRQVRNLHPGVTLALVGNGGDAFASDGVVPLGVLASEQIATLLEQTGTLIVPSRAENSPLIIAEAAARGVSSLVHHVGGMPDMIQDLQSGSSFRNQRELYESMCSLATENRTQRDGERKGLSARALHLCSPASVSAQYDRLYSL